MNEEQLRKYAIHLYLEGKNPSSICIELCKSRAWFYKWLNRYEQLLGGDWYKEQSRAPKIVTSKISPEIERLVINIRNQLKNNKYAQIGAISIQWAMKKLGIEPPPIWTIDRILKRHNLTRHKQSPPKKKNDYPGVKYCNVQQMDLVGPRFIKNYGRCYSFNIIDIESHCVQVNPIKSKSTESIVNAIIRFWQTFGIPDFLQMDNEMSFRGSNRHPHSFNLLIRLALAHDVTPIFIPQGEPWRNGIIEKFNDTFERKLFRTQEFIDLDDLRQKALEFEDFHNQYYRYKAHNHHTPLDMFNRNKPVVLLDNNYQLPENIPLIDGNIILIRFIRSNRKLNIWGESFDVSKELVYSYVEAIISINAQALKVYQDNKLIQEFRYLTPVDWL